LSVTKRVRCVAGLVGSRDSPLRNPTGRPLTPIQLFAAPAPALRTSVEVSAATPMEAHTKSARAGSATTVVVLPPHDFQFPVHAALLHSCQLVPPSRLRRSPMSWYPVKIRAGSA